MGIFWQDIRFAFRMIWKNRAVTAIAVLTLAIGIGANAALFSLVHGVLVSPFPFPKPEQLMLVSSTWKGHENSTSGPDFLAWTEQNSVFEGLCALDAEDGFTLTQDEEPVAIPGFRVSTSWFDTFGEQPVHGRGFLPEEGSYGNHRVVILGNELWENRFDSDPAIVGSQITIDRIPHTVVGIAPRMMGFIEDLCQIYLPIPKEELRQRRGSHYLMVMGRLKDGVSRQQAQAEMDTIAARLQQEYPRSNKHYGVRLIPLHEALIHEIRWAFLVLYGAVVFLLLIACVNVANLLLAKANARGKEMAVRCALGAGRFRITRQVLTESVVLALLGGALGLLFSHWGLNLLQLIAPKMGSTGNSGIPGFEELSLNPTVLGFTVLLSICTGLLFGFAPALQAARLNINETLKQSGRSASGASSRHRLLGWFVIAEVSLASILLIGAGLLAKSFYSVQNEDYGFDPDGVMVAEFELPENERYGEIQNRAAFCENTVRRIASLPGVKSAAAVNIYPLSTNNSSNSFTIEGRPPLPEGEYISAQYRCATHDHFRALGIPLLKGRFFTPQDDGTGAQVMIVNEEFARRYFPDEDPIGQRISQRGEFREIVGVVGNVKLRTMESEKVRPFMYEPVGQFCWHRMSLLIRTEGDPLALADAVRQQIRDVDPNQPILRIQTMNQVVADTVSVQRFCMILLCLMAGVALLLAIIGIYGVMAYSVSERTHEMGIRMALGAQGADVIALVLKKGLWLAGTGLVIGLIGSFALTRLMRAMLYGISATDPLTFVLVPVLLLLVSLLACYLPARRAAKVDPMVALRYE